MEYGQWQQSFSGEGGSCPHRAEDLELQPYDQVRPLCSWWIGSHNTALSFLLLAPSFSIHSLHSLFHLHVTPLHLINHDLSLGFLSRLDLHSFEKRLLSPVRFSYHSVTAYWAVNLFLPILMIATESTWCHYFWVPEKRTVRKYDHCDWCALFEPRNNCIEISSPHVGDKPRRGSRYPSSSITPLPHPPAPVLRG